MNIQEEANKLIDRINNASDAELEAMLAESNFGSLAHIKAPNPPIYGRTPDGVSVVTCGVNESMSELVARYHP